MVLETLRPKSSIGFRYKRLECNLPARQNRHDAPGQIKKGYVADIVVVKHDPLKGITALQNVSFVMKKGVIYKNE